jgi:hypothetical protein
MGFRADFKKLAQEVFDVLAKIVSKPGTVESMNPHVVQIDQYWSIVDENHIPVLKIIMCDPRRMELPQQAFNVLQGLLPGIVVRLALCEEIPPLNPVDILCNEARYSTYGSETPDEDCHGPRCRDVML